MKWGTFRMVGRTATPLPVGLLHIRIAKQIVVRITDNSGGGGIVAPIRLVNATTKTPVRDLAGEWRFRRAGAIFEKSFEERMRDGQRINHTPTLLYNKMVNPLRDFPIAGVLWYQGESNANNDAQGLAYRSQFNALVTSWRKEFSASARDIPFLWVQLPNYGAPDSVPPRSAAWALVRESMDAALALPKTGRAVTIDIGEGDNIHPRNKEDAGARLARVRRSPLHMESTWRSRDPLSRRGTSMDSVRWSGFSTQMRCTPKMESHRRDLHSRAATSSSCGPMPRFAAAPVRVCSAAVKRPAAVRYAFANDPPVNLVNGAGLPTAPFGTNTW